MTTNPSGKVTKKKPIMPVFNRHKLSAENFSSMVQGVNSQLDSAIGELNHIGSMLSAGCAEGNDLLTYNVASSSEAIKGQLEGVKATLSTCASALEGQAQKFDTEEQNNWIAENEYSDTKE